LLQNLLESFKNDKDKFYKYLDEFESVAFLLSCGVKDLADRESL